MPGDGLLPEWSEDDAVAAEVADALAAMEGGTPAPGLDPAPMSVEAPSPILPPGTVSSDPRDIAEPPDPNAPGLYDNLFDGLHASPSQQQPTEVRQAVSPSALAAAPDASGDGRDPRDVAIDVNTQGNRSAAEIAEEQRRSRVQRSEDIGGGDPGSQQARRTNQGEITLFGTNARGRLDVGANIPSPTGRRGGTGYAAVLERVLTTHGPVSERTAAALDAARRTAQQARTAAAELAANGMLNDADQLDEYADAQEADALEMLDADAQARKEVGLQIGKLNEVVQAIENTTIDPNRIFTNTGSSNRFAAALAIAVGTMAQASNPGTQNAALQIVNAAIERDVRAQVADVNRLSTAASQRGNIITALRQNFGDEQAALEAARAIRHAQVQNKFRATAARQGARETLGAFMVGETAAREAMLASIAAAEQAAMTTTLRTKQALNRGQADALYNQAMGFPAPTRRGGARRSGQSSPQRAGSENFRNIVDEVQRGRQVEVPASWIAQMGPEGVDAALRDVDNVALAQVADGRWFFVNRAQVNPISHEEAAQVDEQAGISIDGLNLTSDQRVRLERNLGGPQAYTAFITAAGILGDIRREGTELLRLHDRVGNETPGTDDRGRAETLTANMQMMLGRFYEMGAISGDREAGEGDAGFLVDMVNNPASFWNPTAEARIRQTLASAQAFVDTRLQAAGVDTARQVVAGKATVDSE